jgi:hypothetical protein
MSKRRPKPKKPKPKNAATSTQPKTPEALASPSPTLRRLRVFSLDPSVDVQLEHSLISRSVLSVPWEPLTRGPVGEYLEVVDVDPSSGCVYDPIDLNDPSLLAQDGLSPSTGNPQFHQQMVYAVGMKTIANFEQVLGRKMMWAERRRDNAGGWVRELRDRYVHRLRIYPHALRDQNAYYSPAKAALLFGYFNAPATDPRDELPGGLVFTSLSHDIIAHEMTHAVLDGMHRRLLDFSNTDMVAFHEAFADIIAIFQHFTLPGLLLDQIQRTRGNLKYDSLLVRLASQFARSTGQGDALRNALGRVDRDGKREAPDPSALGRTFEPHARGAILVAAVFDAFVRMYENRVADLRRIATGGTGVLPDGDIHPDLARRFADEAVRLSQRVLNMSIRAVDYLPPVDVTFGDFLRALITADADFFPEDPRRYRLAFIEAFRDHGIYPLDVRALAEDALRWNVMDDEGWGYVQDLLPPPAVLRTMATAYDSAEMINLLGNADAEDPGAMPGEIGDFFRQKDFNAAADRFLQAAWRRQVASDDPATIQLGERFPSYLVERMFARFLHGWIVHRARTGAMTGDQYVRVGWHLGVDLQGIVRGDSESRLKLEVHAVRPTVRLRADGRSKVELLIVLAQQRRVTLLSNRNDPNSAVLGPEGTPLSFWFRGGATLIVDPEAGKIRYAVSKNILSEGRLSRQMTYLRDELARQGTAAIVRLGLTETMIASRRRLEPFAFAHTSFENRGAY